MKKTTFVTVLIAWALIGVILFSSCTKQRAGGCYVCELEYMRALKVELCSEDGIPTVYTDGVGFSAAVVNCKRK